MAVSDALLRSLMCHAQRLPAGTSGPKGMQEPQLLQIEEADRRYLIDRIELWNHERRRPAPLPALPEDIAVGPAPNTGERHTRQPGCLRDCVNAEPKQRIVRFAVCRRRLSRGRGHGAAHDPSTLDLPQHKAAEKLLALPTNRDGDQVAPGGILFQAGTARPPDARHAGPRAVPARRLDLREEKVDGSRVLCE